MEDSEDTIFSPFKSKIFNFYIKLINFIDNKLILD
jgi:hypothetical protein